MGAHSLGVGLPLLPLGTRGQGAAEHPVGTGQPPKRSFLWPLNAKSAKVEKLIYLSLFCSLSVLNLLFRCPFHESRDLFWRPFSSLLYLWSQNNAQAMADAQKTTDGEINE